MKILVFLFTLVIFLPQGHSSPTHILSRKDACLKHLPKYSYLTLKDEAEINKLRKDPCTRYLEENLPVSGAGVKVHRVMGQVPDDPKFSFQWGINDINVMKLWSQNITGSHAVKVAVIDSGVDWDHEDLTGNLYTNPGEAGIFAFNGIDDDQNGYVDDVHGWNVLADSPNTRDDNGHGTHISGIIGAMANNRIGITGINWNVSILPIKMLDKDIQGTQVAIIKALEYALTQDVDIINASWSGISHSKIILELMERIRKKGILFVVSAGNEEGNIQTSYHRFPEFYAFDNVIKVAATDKRRALSGISNWGEDVADIGAPGGEILSLYKENKYALLTGTSMAAPHLAGVAALLKSYYPEMNYQDLRKRLLLSSEPLPSLLGKVKTQGTLNAQNAFDGFYPLRKAPGIGPWREEEVEISSPHPLPTKRFKLLVKKPGAKFMRLKFSKLHLKPKERIGLRAKKKEGENYGVAYQLIDKSSDEFTSSYVPGDEILIEFHTSRKNNTGRGFEINAIEYITHEDWEKLEPVDYSSYILNQNQG